MAIVLVTGSEGFVGSRLCARLEEQTSFRCRVVKAIRSGSARSMDANTVALDLLDPGSIDEAISSTRPDCVLHLAAISTTVAAPEAEKGVWETNFEGTRSVLAAMAKHVPTSRIIFPSSAEVYGSSFVDGMPKDELSPVAPDNVYARSKLAVEFMLQSSMPASMSGVALRLFNHTGLGQESKFVVPAFVSQIAAIEQGKQEPTVRVGNIDVYRDFLDVEDVLDLYVQLIMMPSLPKRFAVYNVGSGFSRSLRDILDALISMSSIEIQVEVDPERYRSNAVPRVCSDIALVSETFGWKPKVDFEDTLKTMLDHWREVHKSN
ncbi:NAD-dependent epimerase/dehydratase family protein [Desulfosediminicola sp.]|uniref:NAD-dependent epimerase/dehydratase family protein n=1 Tax=Desulfosediminicola sp. TaxID=2886825 RepID=UPI003AF23315